jgi:hypothetical protein
MHAPFAANIQHCTMASNPGSSSKVPDVGDEGIKGDEVPEEIHGGEGSAPEGMSLTSDEVNYLIFRYEAVNFTWRL